MTIIEELHQLQPGKRVETLSFPVGNYVVRGVLTQAAVPESGHLADNDALVYVTADDSTGLGEVAVGLEDINNGLAVLDIENRVESSSVRQVPWIRDTVKKSMIHNDVTKGILDPSSANVSLETLDAVGFKPVPGSADLLEFAA
jgi:hypothetical protein